MSSNQHSTRERWIKLLSQTHSLEVDYSLFIMVAVLDRLEKRLGTTSAAFPSLIFAGLDSVLWFHVSLPPLRENASGSI
jgi:hypothetical protein